VVIVDTTVWIDYFGGISNPYSDWLDRELPATRLGLTDMSLCEVLQGIRNDSNFTLVRDELLKLDVCEPGGAELALAAARNYRLLRSRGYTVRKTIDCLIATYCLENGHSLLHRDRDFDCFEKLLGLVVVHP
jgi:hypothetical protein